MGRQRRPLQSVRCAAPQFPIKVLTRALGDKIDIYTQTQHREDRRTRTRHKRRADFRLFEQPHFELREKNKFLENRTLEIVEKRLAGEFLNFVRNAGNLSRILPARVGPFRGNSKFRFHEQDRQWSRREPSDIDG